MAVLSLREGKVIEGLWKRVLLMRDHISGTRKAGAGRVPFSKLCSRNDRGRAREQRGIPMWPTCGWIHMWPCNALQRVASRPYVPQATLLLRYNALQVARREKARQPTGLAFVPSPQSTPACGRTLKKRHPLRQPRVCAIRLKTSRSVLADLGTLWTFGKSHRSGLAHTEKPRK
jgi:hypothetical protein